jgi:Cu(I)/Ag(I) efflux system membrane fusion protein
MKRYLIIESMNQFLKNHLVLLVITCFGLGFFTHWKFNRNDQHQSVGKSEEHQHEEKKILFWSCAMHPEVQMPGPGKCPICQMDLGPVYDSGKEKKVSLRQLTRSPEAVALMNIQTIPVQKKYVTAEVRMFGKVEYDQTRLKHITARMPGRLDRLFVDSIGIPVKKGDHLVQLYSEDLYTAQDVLIRSLRARGTSKRRDPLFAGELDVVESTREKLRLWGMTAEQIRRIEKLEKPSEHMTIYSPIEGIVTQKYLLEGERVKTGDRIYAIADLSQLWVKLDAYESDLTWLRFGQEVTFTTEVYPGESFVGKISLIDPYLNPKTRTVKVRVNVPNLHGKMKPGMFVRGVVRAELAGQGRVMDPGLAGKWISPMHPEIIRDRPGKCPVCGMPLVTAEELGYVSAKSGDAEKPLVIPVSAALVTGKRAIVYVHLTGTKQPTFEGREIVLGPRAGDYYLVNSGLKVGELVVTNGNFKIDSALQIQSKPSMMTPEGGGGGSAHQHGGHGKGTKKEEAHKEHGKPQLPLPFQAALHRLETVYQEVTQALKSGDAGKIKNALNDMRTVLQERQKHSQHLTDDTGLHWKELSMLLENDLVEGRDAKGMKEIHQAGDKLAATMQRIRMKFGLSHDAHQSKDRPLYDVPERFQVQLSRFWGTYREVQMTLAGDNLKASQQAVNRLQRASVGIEMSLLQPEAHTAWMKTQPKLRTVIENLKQSKDLKTLRVHFEPLSKEMLRIVKTFGTGPGEQVYQLHCPMAFNNKGASWLQSDNQVRNPYFGVSMLKCADRLTLISTGTEHRHNLEGKRQTHQHNGTQPTKKRNGTTTPQKEGHRHE